MLINISLWNVSSFKYPQNLSMACSALKKDDFLQDNTVEMDNGKKLLKSSLIYGANASGKTNLLRSVEFFKAIVLRSYADLERHYTKLIMPFFLDKAFLETPSVLEIIFTENGIQYRYGLSILKGEIEQEWLFYTQKRESLLFHRRNNEVEYNKKIFREAKDFIQQQGDLHIIQKTARHVPFVSVLAVAQGEHSQNVVKFFSRIHYVTGSQDHRVGDYTFSLMLKDEDFYLWAKDVLKQFYISDLHIQEIDATPEIALDNSDVQAKMSIGLAEKELKVRVQKTLPGTEEKIDIPLGLESEGTKKMIHLLGPIYDTLKYGNVLLIDEFDAKFHTLLSQYILDLFHQNSRDSQLIVNVQDTNLMDTKHLRRDQIWFVHKDMLEEDSRLYALSEYKVMIKDSYSEDYLQGAFDAIPLFASKEQVSQLME